MADARMSTSIFTIQVADEDVNFVLYSEVCIERKESSRADEFSSPSTVLCTCPGPGVKLTLLKLVEVPADPESL